MTKTEAFSILGLSPTAGKTEIKKRYRQLMTQVHPDVHESFREAYPYTAQEINTAYALLEKETPVFQNADASGYHKTAHSFCSIDLWVKLIPKGLKEMPENLNLQIQQLLASIKT